MIKVLQGCSQFSALLLQDRQYAICHTLIIRRLFLPTAMWASMYSPADALLYQSIRSYNYGLNPVISNNCSQSVNLVYITAKLSA